MAPDLLDETLNISISRDQRQAWERSLLLIAGISPNEASRIAQLAAQDRAAVERMSDVSKFSDEELTEAFEYLDELRESGETNMFGAGRYIERELEHSPSDAKALLSAWMKTFSPQATVEQRVMEARSA